MGESFEEDVKVYSARAAAKLLGVNYRWLLKQISRGQTPFYEAPGGWRISGAMLRKYANGEWRPKE